MRDLVRAFDWSRTPLGPMAGWPLTLKTAVDTCLASSCATLVWWGPDLINIYNDAHLPVLGDRHPGALGRPACQVWADVWASIADDVDGVMARGVPVIRERARFDLTRNGRVEETYFNYSLSPIPDGRGGIGGLFHLATEETGRVMADRARDQERERGEVAVRAGKAAAEAGLARWQSVIASMAEGVILADAAGNLIDWNRAALAIHGYDGVEQALVPLSAIAATFQLTTPDGVPLPFEQWPMSRLLAGEVFKDQQFHLRRRDTGVDHVVSYSGALIRGTDDPVRLALLTLHEVSGVRRPPDFSSLTGSVAVRGESKDQRIERLADEAAEHVEAMLHDMDLSVGEREFCKSLGERLVDQAIDAYLTTRQQGMNHDGSCIAASVAVALMIVREPS